MENAKQNVKVLIVEDDVMLNKIYQTKLGIVGYKMFSAYHAQEGIKKMEETLPNIVLLDLMLPKKNGFEVLETVKQNIKLNHIPVIILSNLGQGDDIERGRALGADDFLVKSNVKLEMVLEKIEQVLQKHGIKV